jgi:hypothetical protein
MGLPASQRRNLEEIEIALRGSDPWLVSLFTIFTRLNLDEEMPRVEQLRARAARLTGRLAAAGRWLMAARRARLRSALLVPAALVAVVSTVLVGAGLPSSARCAALHRGSLAHVARQLRCPPAVAYPRYISR